MVSTIRKSSRVSSSIAQQNFIVKKQRKKDPHRLKNCQCKENILKKRK